MVSRNMVPGGMVFGNRGFRIVALGINACVAPAEEQHPHLFGDFRGGSHGRNIPTDIKSVIGVVLKNITSSMEN